MRSGGIIRKIKDNGKLSGYYLDDEKEVFFAVARGVAVITKLMDELREVPIAPTVKLRFLAIAFNLTIDKMREILLKRYLPNERVRLK